MSTGTIGLPCLMLRGCVVKQKEAGALGERNPSSLLSGLGGKIPSAFTETYIFICDETSFQEPS